MGRVYRHFLTTLPLLGVVAGGSRFIRAPPPDPNTIINTLGNTVGAATIGITSLLDGLLDVTLDTVDDILTNIGLLTSAPLTVLDPLLLALEHPHPRDPRTRGWQYFGCFDPDVYLSTKASFKSGLVNGAMSAKICIDLCIADQKDYATVQGGLCYCASEPPRTDTCTDKCNLPCPLNLDQFCGGPGIPLVAAITVYKRVVSTLAMPKPAYPANWVYNGCFYLQAWLSLLNPTNSYSETPVGGTDGTRCSALCSGKSDSYTTAAISDGTCYCSSLAIGASLLAGDGECARQCTSSPGECCGGQSIVGAKLVISYTKRPAAPVSIPPVPGTEPAGGWYNWGCYWGEDYLLDTILTGLQISSILDGLGPDMSGSTCVTRCKSASSAYDFAMTLAGVCFCNTKRPTSNLQVVSQLL